MWCAMPFYIGSCYNDIRLHFPKGTSTLMAIWVFVHTCTYISMFWDAENTVFRIFITPTITMNPRDESLMCSRFPLCYYCSLVTPCDIMKFDQHWYRWSFGNLCLNQYWLLVNSTSRNEFIKVKNSYKEMHLKCYLQNGDHLVLA